MYFHNTLRFSATQIGLGEAALRYLNQGYSVIPIHGDNKPSQPKSAAITWKAFQSQHPTPEMIHHWFQDTGHGGLAIITGRISQLAVLDFDSSELFREFCHQYPELSKTYRVRTRRGYHLYYHIPEHVHTQSRRLSGADWQFEGRYVIAPPTRINGVTYCAENTLNPRSLTQNDITCLTTYFEAHSSDATPSSFHVNLSTRHLSATDLSNLYRKHAQAGSRNSSLFQTACIARDHGWSIDQVMALLSPLHQDNAFDHETVDQRQREAQATIQSAYSRPARPISQPSSHALPNAIKEALFRQGLTCVVRVLEALYQKGYEAGTVISRPDLFDVLLEVGIGHHSIKRALAVIAPNGTSILKKVSPKPPSTTNVARASAQTHTNKCYLLSLAKPSKTSKGGRPVHYYQIPSHAEMAEMFNVPIGYVADDLPLECLQSAKSTREAYHRAFIARRPGQYTSQFLAWRMGVSITTKNRYDTHIPDLHKRPCYTEVRLFWDNLNEIPDEEVPGFFLQDNTGQKYPAQQGIAYRLLGQGKSLSLMKQTANYYWVGHRFEVQAQDLIYVRNSSEKPIDPWRERAKPYWQSVFAPTGTEGGHNSPKTGQIGVLSSLKAQYPSTPRNTPYQAIAETRPAHDPQCAFADTFLEQTAHAVQAHINDLNKQAISLRNVRRLIGLYGRKAVWSAMKRVEARHGVENPAGLMTVILRSEATINQLGHI